MKHLAEYLGFPLHLENSALGRFSLLVTKWEDANSINTLLLHLALQRCCLFYVVFFTKEVFFPSLLDKMLRAETSGKISQECQKKRQKKCLNTEDVKYLQMKQD